MALSGKTEDCFDALDRADYDKFWNIISTGRPEDTCYSGENALHLFCDHPTQNMIDPNTPDRIKLIKRLLEWKVNINAQDYLGETPLYLAIVKKDIAIIPFLLANGANRRIKITPLGERGTASATSLVGFFERKTEEIPMTKLFMLNGAKIDEFFEDAPEAHARFPRNPAAVEFYESILRARQIAAILIGLHRCKRSPLFLICGKDCISLIARIVYSTRGDCVWTDQPTEANN